MRAPRAQIALAAVTLVLGLLVVVQLRAQTAGSGLGELSAQELTILVANLNERNDHLRTEIATLEGQAADLASGQAQGETSVGQLEQDLTRVRIWSGLETVGGRGIRVTVGGPIPGAAVEDVLNELRNSGAEALAVDGIRIVPGSVVAGPGGSLAVESTPLGDPFEISAIGNPEALTGALTRAGGLVAQFAATYPDVAVTVIPVDRVELTATERSLVPKHGRPRL